MRQLQRCNQLILRHFIGCALHHKYRLTRASQAQIQFGNCHLLISRVEHELAINQANAHSADWAGKRRHAKRNIRDCERSTCTHNRQHVGRIHMVSGKRGNDDLHFIAQVFGKQRAQRTINQPRYENRLLAWAAFPPKERSGDFSD